MILFIAPNPHTTKDRDGYLQRVMAIDELFSDEEKYYYHDFKDDPSKLHSLIAESRMIYVHSVYQAHFIKDYYELLGSKIITDLHGVVPEEEELSGNIAQSEYMSSIEELVVRTSRVLISVSEEMCKHFEKKYKNTNFNTRWIQLPIFEVTLQDLEKDTDAHKKVVYAGGVQPWQNIDLMKRAINSQDKYSYIILTPQPECFDDIQKSVYKRSLIKSVKSSEVSHYYKRAMMGFVLRDDIIVNRVACPTKLIEYLAYGVVPIVKSSRIGDFKNMGYKYIKVEQFMNGNISESFLRNSIVANKKVFKKLQNNTKYGREELVHIYDTLGQNTINTTKYAVEAVSELKALADRINTLYEEVENLKNSHATSQQLYESVINSKRWRIASALVYPLIHIRRVFGKWR